MSAVKRGSGFSLIEMTVTLAVFAILVAATVPTMRKWIADSKVRSVAEALQNGVRLAQAESLRRSRQVVFALTNDVATNTTFTASGSGTYWAIATIPAMASADESAVLIQNGVLGAAATSAVQVSGPAEICFNSVGRMVANSSPGVGGGACTLPTGTSTKQSYTISLTGADLSLQVDVGLGGQVHLCNPSQTSSATNPYAC